MENNKNSRPDFDIDNIKRLKSNRSGAIEMSIGTIVIIVIAVTMLIFGIVFVRNIMCSAISLTSDLNDNVKGEITKLFGATGAEVQCIGGGGEPVSLVPGKVNIIYCGVKAKTTAQYSIEVTKLKDGNSITEDMLQSWVIGGEDSWTGTVAPGDDLPKKILRLQIPENAAEDNIIVSVEIKKDGAVISSQDLDFVTRRTGLVKSAMC